jgi:hypothetical protein
MKMPKKRNDKRTTFYDINFDVDAYLAKGGRLLDLVLTGNSPPEILSLAQSGGIKDETLERMGRAGRFFHCLMEYGESHELVGTALTEEQLRSIWERTK